MTLVLGVTQARADVGGPASPPPATSAVPQPPVTVIRTSTGDVIRGVIVHQDAQWIELDHPTLGTLRFPRPAVVSVEPADERAPPLPVGPVGAEAAADVPAAEASPDAKPSAQPTEKVSEGPKSPWSASIAAAVNYTDNNDTTIDARLAGSLAYTIEDVESLTLSAEYFFKTLNSNTTDNNLLVNAVYDQYVTETNWLWFLKGQYQYSQFEAWEHRISGYGGVGYRFFKSPPLELLTKVGAGGTHEFGPPQQTMPEGYAEAQLAWLISQVQRLELSSNVAPDLSDFGEFRVISRAEWQLKLDPEFDLSLTMGVRSQYQSDVPPGDVHHDLRIYAGLKLGF